MEAIKTSKLQQKASYLKGLAEGLGLEKSSAEGRVLTQIISMLADMADELGVLYETQHDLQESVSVLDESVGELEDDYWGWDEDSEDGNDDDDFVQLECPECHEKIYFEEEALTDENLGEVSCPRCGEIVLKFGEQGCDCDPKESAPLTK